MLLKYLDIQGFKSFPDKTRVAFGKGLTAVVGPNGSGKSNISDAVAWVMGEQSTKTLRGAKMEDVIFAGTKTRKAQGFAEVSLTVDNSNREFEIDSDEVTITRKYYRSGESEYMINRANVRLKDINEIFMDTGLGKDGYSLVGQGKIAEIVQSKSNERREIFEEAAGISKFRYRKNESERSLTHAEENLVRLRDILAELEGRVAPLREQCEKAKKFIEFSDKKKVLEISIWNDTIERSNQLLKDQSDKILVANNQREELEEQIAKLEQDMQKTFEQMQACLVLMDNKRHEKDSLEGIISQMNAEIAVCKNDISHNNQNSQRIENEINSANKVGIDIENEIQQKQEELQKAKNNLVEIEKSIADKQAELFSKNSENATFTQKQQELSDDMNKLLLEQSQMKMTIAQFALNSEDIAASIARNDVEYKMRQSELSKYSSEKDDTANSINVLNDKISELNNTYSGHKIKLENRRLSLETIKKTCENSDLSIKEKQQKIKLLEALESNFDGFAYSVKEVLKRAKNGVISGVHGTVSQVIDVKSDYSVAIEIALGGAMQNIIVDNENSAKSAIRTLQQQNLGRATFLPITSISGQQLQVQGLSEFAGYVDIASNLVSYDKKYQPIIESLLGKIVIVDDIDTAVLIAKKYNYRFRIVTLDGQVVNAGGSLTGGSHNKNQGFLSRKNDIQALNVDVAKLVDAHAQNMNLLAKLRQEVAQIEAEVVAINSEIQTVTEDRIRMESECKRLTQMFEQSKIMISQMENELQSKQEKAILLQSDSEKSQLQLDEIEEKISSVSSILHEIQASTQDSVVEQSQLGDELSQMKIKTVELSKDIEAITHTIEELQKQTKVSNERIEELQKDKNLLLQKNNDIDLKIQTLQKNIEEKKSSIADIQTEITQTGEKRQSLEGKTTESRKSVKELNEQKEKIAAESVRLEERHLTIQREYDEIIAKLWDEYELTKSEALQFATELESIPKATAELNSLKSKIRALGSVNVAAIEEYKEVSERYEFLDAQVKDAEKSRNELLRLINELTQKMQDIFEDNFNKINDNFKTIFVELFGGGRANLKLTDPDNLLESGIEIFVEPPGKIIKNLASLSGGEQSFVAIAIYFAILKVRPAPFCILDEIEAALDDVNVVKYANYLRQMSDKTQFIMITHRRGSMEAADVLYGVTMQDEGVSKLLQLNVSELEAKKIIAN